MDTKVTQLVGSSNFVEWNRDFVRAAKDKDVYDLLSEKFKLLASEPDMDDDKYQSRPTTIPTGAASGSATGGRARATVGQRELRSLGLNTLGGFDNGEDENESSTGSAADATNLASTSIVIPDTSSFARFQHDYSRYEKGQKKIKAARILIKAWVSPIIAGLIRNKDDPVEAYKYLKEKYKVSDTVARQKLLSQLKDTTLNKYKYNVENYINKVFQIREDLRDYTKEITDEEVAEHLLGGLPESYNGFKEKYDWLMRYQGNPDGHDL